MSLKMGIDVQLSHERLAGYAASNQVEANAERFNHLVMVMFENDRAFHLYDNAFTLDDPGAPLKFCWVLTEHQGYHVFSKDELSACIELVEVNRIPSCGDHSREEPYEPLRRMPPGRIVSGGHGAR